MRNKLIIAAVVLVGLASVAYAAYTQILTINGTGTAAGNWDVEITGITLDASSVGATDTPRFDGTSATFNAQLANPGATAVYKVTIKNKGSIPAKLSNITDLASINSAAPTYITYAISGVAVNDTLAPTDTTTATVTVKWLDSSPTTPAFKQATIDFQYDQNT